MSTIPLNFGDKPKTNPAKTELSEKDGLSLEESISEVVEPQSAKRRFALWPRTRVDLDAIATKPSVFDDPATLEVYRPPKGYENAHRFDPTARWTLREEIPIVRKIDIRVALWAFIMFFALDLDRGNISQANTDNFLDDLHMSTNDFNLGNTLFRLCFLIAELPSQLVSKKVGPDVWIPCQMVLWSLISLAQYWLSGRGSFLATRCLLGFAQGGFIPDVVLYLSYYYTTSELPIRLAWFWVSNYVATIAGAFMATGLLQLRGVNGKAGWRYLFLVEGGLTLIVGLLSFVMMPPGPTQTKAWYRPRGWFTEREEVIIVNRVLRDDPTKSEMHNRQGLSVKMIVSVITDWRLWPLYALGLLHMVPVTPPQTYLTLSLRNLGFSTIQSNLLSIPSTVIGGLTLLMAGYFSEMINSRVAATIILQIWALPLLVVLYTFNQQTSQWVYYAVVTLITGFPYVHPVQVAWASSNSSSVRTRTVSASIYNMCVQAGAMIGANIYQASDKVRCLDKRGNRVLIGICSLNICLYIFTYFFYRTINTRRAKKWDTMSPKEQQEYLDTTTDNGNKRLNFRFVY
ncbi:major facilitator superfamily domain-containing protein [Irpex rosettiformis]|uniref:Major facilitator superfamily domain-containing protein n=1 Tax=Irpex rosettiformis TaxID=378272 RepID=A0ACB8ULF7_9APHY|nr:major facilitator superfamily domain-containing protein [Irpex rosettiformis]